MPVNNPKELFVQLLSGLRQGTERSTKIYQEISKFAEDPDVKEALEARAFVSEKVLATLDQCFKLIGEQPTQDNSRLHETFVEDFRRELSEIPNPAARHLFILVKGHPPDSPSHCRIRSVGRGGGCNRPLWRGRAA